MLHVEGRCARSIGAIRYDSRAVEHDDLFVAVNGPDDRGIEFTKAAILAGAAAVITDAPEQMPADALRDNDVTLIVVPDARKAMAQMAHALAGYPARHLKLIGVTGTNGKTTATFVLRQLLNACGERVGLIGTLGKMVSRIVPTGYTTPEAPELATILAEMADEGMTTVVMEVSSHALVLERVALLDFAGAVFTNLTLDHLDFHGSMDAYREAKKKLFDSLRAGAPAAVNVDDPSGNAMVRDRPGDVYRYGSAPDADVRIGAVELDPSGSRWELTLSQRLGGGTLRLATQLLGTFNVWNVTSALTLGLALGYDRLQLHAAVAQLEPVPGRMQSIPLGGGATAVIDYAHTPDALENVLHSLHELRASGGRIIAVFGCGGDRDRSKRPVMGRIAAELADHVILTSDNPRSENPDAIIAEIVAGIEHGVTVDRIVDRQAAIEAGLEMAGPGDMVLVAGKGHEDYQIIGSERRHFSDAEVVREWMARHRPQRAGTP
ncbi:MAG TPA: UDP-N-acetylmuramoyl-L-alanyl-D-glutamate--2,6-diaminopimelate ligase [Candidatus Kapabacteria bacterium]|nr:UDP-N-acetylmuramoyl-L-alanyl-D-glutamate--2,6-diaminopimelate ligase [Candidatus Kapabacteria bacterium]